MIHITNGMCVCVCDAVIVNSRVRSLMREMDGGEGGGREGGREGRKVVDGGLRVRLLFSFKQVFFIHCARFDGMV